MENKQVEEAQSTSDELQPNALNEVFNYYLDKKHLPTLRYELLKQAGLLFVSLSGATLYLLPAQEYAKNDPVWLQISLMLGTTMPALVVLYFATDTFFKIKANEQVPKSLKHVLKGQNRRQAIQENVSIGLGSALSSLPLTGLVITYHLPHATLGFLITQAIVVQIDNTILHFLPIKLALQHPIYRLPYFLTIEQLVKLIKACRRTKEEQKEFAKQMHKMIVHQSLKQLIIDSLDRTAKRVILKDFEFDVKQLQYKINSTLPDIIKTQAADKRQQELIEYGQSFLPSKQSATSGSYLISSINSILRKTTYGLGAGWLIAGLAGYLINPINQLKSYFNNELFAFLASASSLYFLTVLFAFFGGTFAKNTYDYLTSWGKDESKLPLELKLYPKTFTLLMLINIYLSCFSYAAATELINNNFADKRWDFLRPILLLLAQTSIPALSLLALIDFYRTMLNKFALHFGRDEAKMITEIMTCIEQLKNGIMMIDGNQLQADLSKLEEPQLKSLLNLNKNEFNELVAEHDVNEFSIQSSSGENKQSAWCLFFKCGNKSEPDKQAEEKKPLLEKTNKINSLI